MTTTAAWMQVSARVGRHEDAGAGHRWLDLEVPAGFDTPLPGQFVQLRLGPDQAAAVLGRPMSVAGVRRRAQALAIQFLYAPVGTGTRALAALGRGAEVEVLGPLGQGYPLEEPGHPLLIAGGRGVAPLLYAAEALARQGRRCDLLFGARDRAHLVGVTDARERLARHAGRLHLCTDDGSRGLHGNVVDLLERVVARGRGPFVLHACGPHGMLAAVARWALAHGTRAHLAMESVMACGTGVCRGCPLPRSAASRAAYRSDRVPSLFGSRDFAMCCTDGPVFEASELDWERVE
jgi:dihydroorotate dehydrogenase electron transfer subunit